MDLRHQLLILKLRHLRRKQLFLDLLLKLEILHQQTVLRSRRGAVQTSQQVKLALVVTLHCLEHLLVEDEVALCSCGLGIEKSVFVRERVNDRVEKTWLYAFDKLMNFIVVGVQTIRQALSEVKCT